MNLVKAMLTFLTVLEEQSVTRAANKLFLTPTAVSKQLKQLEQEFGQPLLTRTTRKMAVTDLGARFYQHCLQLQGDLEQAKAFMSFQQQEPQGKLRILSSLYFTTAFLTPHLFEFHQRYPRIELWVDASDRHPDLGQESFDVMVGFRNLGKATAQLRRRKLKESHFVLCAAPKYLQRQGVPQTPQDLLQHQLINHPARQPDNLIRFKDGTEIFMNPPQIIINNLAVLLQLCCEGAGVLMMAEMDAIPWLAQNKLVQLLPHYPLETFTIYGFYLQAPYEQPNVRCFLDFMLEKMIQ